MEQQIVITTEPQAEMPIVEKLPYVLPAVTFVAVELEERIGECYDAFTKCKTNDG